MILYIHKRDDMPKKHRLIIFLTIILGLVLIFTIFTRGGSNKTQTKKEKPQPPKPLVLTDYIERDSKVVFTVDGQVVADEKHQAVRITVGRSSKQIEILQGYQGNVIKSQSFDNNQQAYDVFLRALSRLGFAKKRSTTVTDERGVCPTGQRYISQIIDNNDQVLRTWSISCGSGGTSGAVTPSVLSLFQKQVPDYSKFTSGVAL